MIKTFVRLGNTWQDGPNLVTFPGLIGGFACVFTGLILLFSGVLTTITLGLGLIIFCSVYWAIVLLHPLGRMMRQGEWHRSAWEAYDNLPKSIKTSLPSVTIQDLTQMNSDECAELTRHCKQLLRTYKEQQSILRTPAHLQFVDEAENLHKQIESENTSLKAMS